MIWHSLQLGSLSSLTALPLGCLLPPGHSLWPRAGSSSSPPSLMLEGSWISHQAPVPLQRSLHSFPRGSYPVSQLSILSLSLFFVLFCGILVPQPGIEPGPRQWKHQLLTTGLPGNSLDPVSMLLSPKWTSPLLCPPQTLHLYIQPQYPPTLLGGDSHLNPACLKQDSSCLPSPSKPRSSHFPLSSPSINGNSILPVAQDLGAMLDPCLSHPTAKPSANPTCLTSKCI